MSKIINDSVSKACQMFGNDSSTARIATYVAESVLAAVKDVVDESTIFITDGLGTSFADRSIRRITQENAQIIKRKLSI